MTDTQTYYENPETGKWSPAIHNEIRAKRNRLLYETDWTQLPNNPLTTEKQTAWANYRQELRDITVQSGYPTSITWPPKPN